MRAANRVGMLAGVAMVCGAGVASAQNPPISVEEGYSVERFRLATDRGGILDVESSDVGRPMELQLGFWLGYADDPLNVYREGEIERQRVGSLVSHRLGGNLIAALSLGHQLQIGVDLPLIFSQSEDIDQLMTTGAAISSFGLGDIRLVPKLQIRRLPAFGRGVGVAVALGATVPTGTEDNYFGDDGGTLAPELIVSGRATGKTRLGLNLGYRVRREQRALDLEINDELYAHLGVGYQASDRLELMATYGVAVAAGSPFRSVDDVYSELRGGGSYRLGKLSVFAAIGLGTSEGVGAPDWRMVSGIRFDVGRPGGREPQLRLTVRTEPTVADADGDLDGLLDSLDDCPRMPEDFDEFEDHDGCPEFDNDRDLVADADDACPNDPGPIELRGCRVQDRDGDGVRDAVDNCPDTAGKPDFQGCGKKQLVVLAADAIAVLEQVLFRTGSARVRLRSYPLLRNVAEVLKNHPSIKRVRIEGHTDSQGSAERNLELSRRRAEMVRSFLVAQGVAEARLEAVGVGETQPIGDNGTPEGRAQNRRVEFRLVGGE